MPTPNSKQLQNTEHVVAVAANDYISAVEQQLDAASTEERLRATANIAASRAVLFAAVSLWREKQNVAANK